MAMTAIGGGGGFPLLPVWAMIGPTSGTSANVDAVGDGLQCVGRIMMPGGPGTSKVLSAAGGGKIHWYSQATSTFANAGTNLRAGVQDVTSGGVGDGTFDVYADLVGGGGGVANGGRNTSTMTTGTKTIAHGDTIAIVLEFTARAGVDAIRPLTANAELTTSPYTATSTTGTYNKQTENPFIMIEFDDGTIGYFTDYTLPILETQQTFNSGSTPDEYALIFQVAVAMRVLALVVWVGDLDAGDTGEVLLYTTPLGTPAAAVTLSLGDNNCGNPSTLLAAAVAPLATAYDLSALTDYAIAYRPTSTNNRICSIMSLPIAGARAALPFGASMQGGSRTNQTGAFGTLSTTSMLRAGLIVSHVEIPAAGAGAFSAAYPG